MKESRCSLAGVLGLLVVLILAAGCYRPAAPDVTMDPSGLIDSSPLGTPDLEATAIANATEAAETVAAQPAEEQEPAEATPEAPATEPPPPTTEPAPPAEDTPEPTPWAPVEEPAPTAPPSAETTHIVQLNETLFGIAVRYGTTVDAIAEANGIVNPEAIYVGQQLIIPSTGVQPPPPVPGETTHVVQPGENLFRIALRYNLDYQRLAEYNGLADPADIYIGQVLRIPQQ